MKDKAKKKKKLQKKNQQTFSSPGIFNLCARAQNSSAQPTFSESARNVRIVDPEAQRSYFGRTKKT